MYANAGSINTYSCQQRKIRIPKLCSLLAGLAVITDFSPFFRIVSHVFIVKYMRRLCNLLFFLCL